MARTKSGQKEITTQHQKQVPRLKRIEGQVRGLQQMIADERDCVEIAHQINAVIAALRRVQGDMLSEHLSTSAAAALNGKLPTAKVKRLAEEVGALIARFG